MAPYVYIKNYQTENVFPVTCGTEIYSYPGVHTIFPAFGNCLRRSYRKDVIQKRYSGTLFILKRGCYGDDFCMVLSYTNAVNFYLLNKKLLYFVSDAFWLI